MKESYIILPRGKILGKDLHVITRVFFSFVSSKIFKNLDYTPTKADLVESWKYFRASILLVL